MAADLISIKNKLESVRSGLKTIDEELGRNESKGESMDPVLFAFLFVVSATADLFEIFTLGTLGWFVGLIANGILLVALGSSSAFKKQWRRMLVGIVPDSFPGLGIIPWRTTFLVWSYIKTR